MHRDATTTFRHRHRAVVAEQHTERLLGSQLHRIRAAVEIPHHRVTVQRRRHHRAAVLADGNAPGVEIAEHSSFDCTVGVPDPKGDLSRPEVGR